MPCDEMREAEQIAERLSEAVRQPIDIGKGGIAVSAGISIGMLPNPKNPEWEELAAVSAAIENAQIMASHLGLASKWSSGDIGTHPLVASFVGLKAPAKLLGFLYVGKPARPWPAATRGALAEKVRWAE